ncbi:MAG: NADH-quinone oxidoreductase subunit NuoE [Amylibacter sp.]|nr:NADH-quinone oxidoreductase subunit NuoE [Amylibacter sp.]MDG1237204.1 NADH-quinone oxidoreductase subunit NuoE [Amylibacter sp.]MDG1999209.1 NADH-quinone oxidoreductase subunit NuoE [Amylibacter sp.]
MLRRLHNEQPDNFTFTEMNQKWAEGQLTKYPEGRQASAVIPLLWRAQEQEGWISKPALETVADMLDMAYIRVLEVATFYFMFQLQPVGSVAHIQVCGTTSCMICGAEDLISVCREKISETAHVISEDGKFSWEEVECLGACANAPMAQIGKDYYEDLTVERFTKIIDEFAAGKIPTPGPQNGRFAAEPMGGLTALTKLKKDRPAHNGSVALAIGIGDTVKRIQGDEVPILTPWLDRGKAANSKKSVSQQTGAKSASHTKVAARMMTKKAVDVTVTLVGKKPRTMTAPRKRGADNLKLMSGIGPKLEDALNSLGIYHFNQISKWSDAEVEWVDKHLKLNGRLRRDNWMEQATKLVIGETATLPKKTFN